MFQMPNQNGSSDHSLKPKKTKSREVSSRFLSPTSTDHRSTHASSPFHENYGCESPKTDLLSLTQKPRSSTDSRKHKSLESSGFLRSLWPSSSPQNSKRDGEFTLEDHLGKDRLRDKHESKPADYSKSLLLNRQRSCRESSVSNKEFEKNSFAKENHKPFFGGSMRYTGKFKFPGKSSSKFSNKYALDDSDENHDRSIVPGRFSVDEAALRKRSYLVKGLSDSDTQDSESEYSDICSGNTSFDAPVAGKHLLASYMASTESSRKHGIDIPSRFLQDSLSRSRRWASDSSGAIEHKPVSSDNSNNNNTVYSSPKLFSSKNGINKANNTLMRSDSSSYFDVKKKPPTSPSRGKGVGNFLSMGIELLKGKKSSSATSSSSPLGPGSVESFHQLKLLHDRLMQWRYCNAKAEAVNGHLMKQAESNFLQAWNGLPKLQHSVIQKRLQLQKEKLDIKLNYIIQSQIKALEDWGNIEREHLSAMSTTKDYLHHVVCRIPLVDRAMIETQSTSTVLRQASDLATSIDLMLKSFSPAAENTVGILFELAFVVTQEKLLLEECLEIFRNLSALEIQERSLKSSILQFNN